MTMQPDKQLARLVQRIKTRNNDYAIETGRDLIAAKTILGHGKFGPWLKSNFGWSTSSAQNFMNAAKLAEKNPKVANLKPSAAMALAAKSTPEAVKKQVLADLDAGKVPTPKEVKSKIRAAKPSATKEESGFEALVALMMKLGEEQSKKAFQTAFPAKTSKKSLAPLSRLAM